MDKLYTKVVVAARGIRQADFVGVMKEELKDMDRVCRRIEERFAYPVFIKPCNAGSSCGVSRADDRKMLEEGLKVAAEHDRKILVEEMIRGREIECAVFGGGETPVRAFGVGEILAAAEFYDYDAKYNNPDSRTVVEPALPEGVRERLMKDAEEVFRAVDGYGLSRVDFFVTEDGSVIFNEINTMPGFTGISMYPMIMDSAGVSRKELVTNLIEHGMKRYMR
jgi:D-alanine-D-alanine ligase